MRKEDITEIRTMAKPPELIKMTMESIAIFLSEKPVKVPDLNDRSKMVWDFWPPIIKMLQNPKFLVRL